MKRDPNTTKWDYGHALLIAGSYGKMGCAILASRACMRSGVGLLTLHLPSRCVDLIQMALPEAMTSIDPSDTIFTMPPSRLDHYQALGIGPGIGTDPKTQEALLQLLKQTCMPVVLDADALNIIAECGTENLPQGAVITPHEKEYSRLFHEADPSEMAVRYQITIVKKAHHTMIYGPNGEISENTTGNPGMATAGSGDVLTGIILAFLTQGYSPFEAARYGTFIHGKSGDIAAQRCGECAMIASDIVENLKYAIR